MKRILAVLTPLFFMLSCSDDAPQQKEVQSNEIKIELGSFGEGTDLVEVLCDSLKKDSSGKYTHKGERFTGRCFSLYPDSDKRYMEISYYQGDLHGFFTVYDKSGNVLSKDRYHQGERLIQTSNSNMIMCPCDSLSKEKLTFGNQYIYKYKDHPFSGICFSNYPNSSLKYMETEYKDGLPDGTMTVYDRQGKVVAEEKYSKGEKVN